MHKNLRREIGSQWEREGGLAFSSCICPVLLDLVVVVLHGYIIHDRKILISPI